LNHPLNHHFVPRNYFKPWADCEQKLVVYERRDGVVFPPYKRSTKSICVRRGLYSYSFEVEEANRQAIEQKLLSKIDNDGALVLQKMNASTGNPSLTDQERYNFAVFINSLILRTPEAFKYGTKKGEIILRRVLEEEDPHLKFTEIKKILNGLTLPEWFEKHQPVFWRNFGSEQMANLFFEPRFVSRFMQMHWIVLERSSPDAYLLTSDRPLIMFGNSNDKNFGVALTVSPRRVFLATADHGSLKSVLELKTKQFIRVMNTSTIQQAESMAFALDRSHSLNFFEKQLGTNHFSLPWARPPAIT
jgi:Protein of unknown function (DUF4238)